MRAVSPLLTVGAALLMILAPSPCIAFQCCTTPLSNGSVSYTLDQAFPNESTRIWTQNGKVIVAEDGSTDPGYVLCLTGKGLILTRSYTNVVCKLESPEHGLSKEILCSEAHCGPTSQSTPPDGTTSPPTHSNTNHIIIGIAVPLCLLGLLVLGFFICRRRQRRHRRENGIDTEMQPVNGQDQRQDQRQHQSPVQD